MLIKQILIYIASILFCLTSCGAQGLNKDVCLPIVKEFESVSNVSPKEVEAKAPTVLDRLREGESMTFYFIAYNIYVENLFNQGKIDKANHELDAMITEALSQDDPECQTIALRTQGQFYYKLGLYDRALESFRKAMRICPPYNSERLMSYFTWSSTLFWLVHTDLQTGHIDDAEKWLSKMDDMMLWLDEKGIVDHVGYKPVMMLGLKARIALQKGDIETARTLLDKCRQYMLPDIPSRAYVEYYVGQMMLAVKEGRHADAIPLLDDLIDIHDNDYKPIAAKFLYQKANSLYVLGRYQQCAETFKQYEDLQSQIDEISIAHQLDELSTRYDVEKLQHERDLMRNNLILAVVICIALSIIIAIVVTSRKKFKQRNIVLAQNISDLHQLLRHKDNEDGPEASEPDSTPNPEYIAVGNSVVEYIKTSKCFLSPNCGRETIKEALGVSEQLLSKAIPLVTGMTFVNYINRLRLDYAIDLLDNNPEITINKISAMCGFGTLRQFQRIFKQHYDLSPSAYRAAREHSQNVKPQSDDTSD